jgi:hypothetical protein
MGISILSYDGAVHFGLITDAKLVPDPELIINRFAAEFEKLLLIALMEDWNTDITPADAEATLRRFVATQDAAPVKKKASRRRRAEAANAPVAPAAAKPVAAARPRRETAAAAQKRKLHELA